MKQATNFSAKGLKEFRALVNKEQLKEDTVYQIGRGEVGVDASYQRIDKALDALKHIADTMSDNGYYATEESALRSQISYIEQEINYIRKRLSGGNE